MTDSSNTPDQPQEGSSTPASGNNRPKPQYGELAPEGWNWQPPEQQDDARQDDPPSVAARAQSAGQTAEQPARSVSVGQPAENFGPVAGVPHNLGAKGGSRSLPRTVAPDTRVNGEQPYRSTDPGQPAQQPYQPQQPAQFAQQPGAVTERKRPRDLVPTVILLFVGAMGALILAASTRELPASIAMLASAAELENFSMPSFIPTMSTIGAIVILAYWAVALLWSISRIRAKKLSFWVPLAAGALAIATVFIVSMIAVYAAVPPEVLQDPEMLQRLMQSLQ